MLALMAAGDSPLSLSLSPTSLTKGGDAGGAPVTTNPVTGTASGGAGGYTYAWSYISGDLFTIDSPTSATTTFTYAPEFVQAYVGTYRLTVTDAAGATTFQNMTVTFNGL